MPTPAKRSAQAAARDVARRRKLEQLRQEQQAARRRRGVALGSGAGVVLVVVVLVVVKALGGGSAAPAAPAVAASATVAHDLTTVPQTVLDQVGKGTGVTAPTPITGAPALTSGGRPEVVYLGAEYCPFCAAERWAVAQALSRFGTLSGLGETHSSSTDSYPNTATLSFHGATYTSDYLTFRGFEQTTNQPDGDGGYTKLDPTPADVAALVTKYDATPYVPAQAAGAIPFVDLGGHALVVGASYSPQLLAGLTQDQIAAELANPGSPVAQGVIGAANAITAKLCDLTGDQPVTVCATTAVTAARGSG